MSGWCRVRFDDMSYVNSMQMRPRNNSTTAYYYFKESQLQLLPPLHGGKRALPSISTSFETFSVETSVLQHPSITLSSSVSAPERQQLNESTTVIRKSSVKEGQEGCKSQRGKRKHRKKSKRSKGAKAEAECDTTRAISRSE